MDQDDKQRELKAKIKKIFFSIMSIFILVIFVLYAVMTYDLQDIVAGLLVSHKVDDLQVAYKGYVITFSQEVYKDLRSLYFANLQQEFKACLSGKKDGNQYDITSLSVPWIFSQSIFQVVSSSCREGTLIDLHSHPYKHCIFSEQDISSYRNVRKTSPDIILGLMCEPDRFTFYRE